MSLLSYFGLFRCLGWWFDNPRVQSAYYSFPQLNVAISNVEVRVPQQVWGRVHSAMAVHWPCRGGRPTDAGVTAGTSTYKYDSLDGILLAHISSSLVLQLTVGNKHYFAQSCASIIYNCNQIIVRSVILYMIRVLNTSVDLVRGIFPNLIIGEEINPFGLVQQLRITMGSFKLIECINVSKSKFVNFYIGTFRYFLVTHQIDCVDNMDKRISQTILNIVDSRCKIAGSITKTRG